MPLDAKDGAGPMSTAFIEEVSPVLVQIHDLCVKYGIPYVAHFQLDTVPNKGVLSAGSYHLDPHYTEMRLRMMASLAAQERVEFYRGDIDENGKVKVGEPLDLENSKEPKN